MLFLAVFLGFMAENYREHLDEQNQERAFIKSYIEDLEADTVAANVNLLYRIEKLSQLDSFMHLLKNNKPDGHESDLYYFGRILLRAKNFQPNDRTIAQLYHSGGMRTIHKKQVSDSIMAYQKFVEVVVGNQKDEQTERYEAFPATTKLFDPFVFDQMVSISGIQRPDSAVRLRSFDAQSRQDLAHHVHMIKGSYFILQLRLKQLKQRGARTIRFLRQEYQLG